MRFVELPLEKPVSKIGLGTWQFGSRRWGYGARYAHDEAARIVRRALELGVTLFDTAEIYSFGRSERILGAALGERRSEVFVATKLFPLLPVAPVVEQRAVASAHRLGLRRIDLYQVHRPTRLVREAATMRGMGVLQDIGLVGEVGVSNYPLDRWQAAEAALGRRVLSNQVRYSLVSREAERDVVPYAEEQQRLVIAHSPLARGFLSGRYTATDRPRNRLRADARLFQPESFVLAKELLGALREIAVARGATVSQVALAWTIRHRSVVAIPGASSVAQLESNAAAADLELDSNEVEALDDAADAFALRR